MKILFLFISFISLLLASLNTSAQNNKRVSGFVTDTSKVSISDANIILVAGKDTLRATTDEKGGFSFSKVKTEQFTITITAVGYQSFNASYNFNEQKSLALPEVALKSGKQMLKEVVIKGKPNPIRIMQDTVEYNAAAYQVFEGDNVADLLKQFPGLEVDNAYNVKTMGQEMTKLRVNGKDFFTNNVSDFISKLPGQIVDKIQIIDDFGDKANFTGVKIGAPKKMLNIVTKPGMNKGKFGNILVNGGTNDQIGSQDNINLWNDTKQIGGNVIYNKQNNGAGKSKNTGISANYRDRIGKNASLGIGYNYEGNDNAFSNEQAVETVSELGNFYNQSQNNGKNNNNNQNLNFDYRYNNKETFVASYARISYNKGNNLNSSFNKQSGVIRQDLKNVNASTNTSPNITANVNLSKKLKKNNFSASLGLSSSTNQSVQNINTNTLYYNKDTNVLEKDSLLNRLLDNSTTNQNFDIGFSYGLNLKKPKDSLINKSINLNYNGSFGRSSNNLLTSVYNNQNTQPNYVDSLSTVFRSIFINQSLGLNYNYNSKKMRLNMGFNLRPSLLSSNYINLGRKIQNNNLNYSPNINLSKTIAESKTISVNYNGNNSSPSQYQLQPVKNTQNLQNIVIGNPELKPSFSHRLSSTYNYIHIKSGTSILFGLNASTTQNEIVNNVVFIPDTLNSLKQETRFENTNGTYSLGSNYNLNIPFKKNKYAISYGGNLDLSNRAIFINNDKKFNKGINFSQNIRGSVMLKVFTLNTSVGYALNTNNNSLIQNNFDNGSFNLGQFSGAAFFRTESYMADVSSTVRLKKFNFSANINYNQTTNENSSVQADFKNIRSVSVFASGQATILKTYRLGFHGSKVFNSGYSLANSNPFIINTFLSKSFLKNQTLNINANANDLLNQGNNISRDIIGNSVIDRRTNQITRVFTLGLSYNLSNFGAARNHFRVDADQVY